jgi:hypothetical protein
MESGKIKTIVIGTGTHQKSVYFTVDLMPVHFVINYNTEHNFGFELTPEWITKIHTVEVYSEIINITCDALGIERKHLICYNDKLPEFDFSLNDSFLEYQYQGKFGRTYYTKSKIQNALRYQDERWNLLNNYSNTWNLSTEDSYYLTSQIERVFDDLRLQKVFTNRDYFYISKSTVDKFIKILER